MSMPDIFPFKGLHFNPKRVSLSGVLCPPYDAIGEKDERILRAKKFNSIHLDLSAGVKKDGYRQAAKLWEFWRKDGTLVRDDSSAIYILEEDFHYGKKTFRRLGFLALVSLSPRNLAQIIPHEKTLPIPRADRLKVLQMVKANLSPIFTVYPDPKGKTEDLIRHLVKGKKFERGRLPVFPHTDCHLWKIDAVDQIAAIQRALKKAPLFVADGHHRLGAACDYFKQNGNPEAGKILAYFCAEDDPGLLVLPTHRVLPKKILDEARDLCHLKSVPSLTILQNSLKKKSPPYAFGIYDSGKYFFALPKDRGGCQSLLTLEWLNYNLLSLISPQDIHYSSDAREAKKMADSLGGAAILVPSFSVADVRRAAQLLGLLPPKSTYFYPKVSSGFVFHAFEN